MRKWHENWQTKLLSLVAAVALWFFVIGIENQVAVYPEQIEVLPIHLAQNISLSTKLSNVKIYLRGEESVIKNLNRGDLSAEINLSGLSAGDYSIPVMAISRNQLVTVVKVEPKEINVSLTPVTEKEVAVVTVARGSPLTGFTLKEVKSLVTKVKIAGAQNILNKVQSVKAELVLTGSEISSISQTVTPEATGIDDFPKNSIKIIPDQLVIQATIEPETKSKTVSIDPIITGVIDHSELLSQVIITPPRLSIQGQETDLSKVDSLGTVPVKVDALLSGQAIPLELVIPAKTSLASSSEKVTIKLVSPMIKKTFMANVEIDEPSSVFTPLRITPLKVRVTVLGTEKNLGNVAENDIKISLNLSGILSAQQIPLGPANTRLPAGLIILEIEPSVISLE